MKVKVKAPGTCGEFIQGIWRQQPCLVSAPIDLFSTVIIKEGKQVQTLKDKSKYLIHYFSKKYGIEKELIDKINITIKSKIPISLGMGSSTADLAALLKALSIYFFVDISNNEIGKVLTKIEPTDNIFFKDLTLFNQYTGDILYNFNKTLSADLLITYIDDLTFNTINFSYQREFLREEINFYEILENFTQGLKYNNLNLIGEACTQSAILNQKCLKNPYFNYSLELKERYLSPGLLIGHTGTLIGFLINKNTKTESIKKHLKSRNKQFKFLEKKLITGGFQIEREFN